MKLDLTVMEIEALYAATGNIDPCMFDEMGPTGGLMFRSWERGRAKLSAALDAIEAKRQAKIKEGKQP